MTEKESEGELIFFNSALEYLEEPYSQTDFLSDTTLNISKSSTNINEKNQLRNEMLTELENLKEILISYSNLDVKSLPKAERKQFRNFINYYAQCPICGNYNHYFNLKRLYFNEKNVSLKNQLLRFMDKRTKKSYHSSINVGVPCCSCYKIFFEEDKITLGNDFIDD